MIGNYRRITSVFVLRLIWWMAMFTHLPSHNPCNRTKQLMSRELMAPISRKWCKMRRPCHHRLATCYIRVSKVPLWQWIHLCDWWVTTTPCPLIATNRLQTHDTSWVPIALRYSSPNSHCNQLEILVVLPTFFGKLPDNAIWQIQ